MGANWYWRDRPCGTCHRYDEIHVGKSGSLWRGYPHRLLNGHHPDWGFQPESPFGFPVVSVADWRRVFVERPGELWDEYGDRVDDPVAWIDGFAPPPPDRVAQWRGWNWRGLAAGDAWVDSQGYLFHAGEFC